MSKQLPPVVFICTEKKKNEPLILTLNLGEANEK